MSFFCFVVVVFVRGCLDIQQKQHTGLTTSDVEQLENSFCLMLAHACRRVCLKWRVCKLLGDIPFEDVRLVEFTYLVLSRTSSESYRGWFRFLLIQVFVVPGFCGCVHVTCLEHVQCVFVRLPEG